MGRVLLVADDPDVRRILAHSLSQDEHEISETSRVEEARNRLANHNYDVIFTEREMSDGGGVAVSAAAREVDPALSVIFLTTSVDFAIESIRDGAYDVLTKPFQPDVVCASARRACERTRLLRENERLKQAVYLEAKGTLPVNSGRGSFGQLIPGALPDFFDLTALLEQAERELIVRTLVATGGAQAEAARRMGLSRSVLAYKLNKYGIRAPGYSGASDWSNRR